MSEHLRLLDEEERETLEGHLYKTRQEEPNKEQEAESIVSSFVSEDGRLIEIKKNSEYLTAEH